MGGAEEEVGGAAEACKVTFYDDDLDALCVLLTLIKINILRPHIQGGGEEAASRAAEAAGGGVACQGAGVAAGQGGCWLR